MPLWPLFKPKQVGKHKEREKIKIVVSFCPVPTRRLVENSNKKQNNSKIPLWHNFKPKQVGKGREENKNFRSAPFLPDAKQKIPKKQQKNLKS